MATVGDNGSLDGEDSSKNEGDVLGNMCKKNGIDHSCFLGDHYRDSVEARFVNSGRMSRLNGTSKSHSVSASFTKPSIPSLRSRKEKLCTETCRRKRRPSKHESSEDKERCISEKHVTNTNGISSNQNANNNKVPSFCLDQSSKCDQLSPDKSRSCTPTSPSSDKQKCVNGKDVPVVAMVIDKMKGPLPDILQSCRSEISDTGPCLLSSAGINVKQSCHQLSPLTSKQTTTNGTDSVFLVPSWIGNNSKPSTPTSSRSGTPLPYGISNNLNSASSTSGVLENGTEVTTTQKETTVTCQWLNCDISLKSTDLMDHIGQKHVETQSSSETFVCLWNGCKVYDKSSCSISWLERHIVCHSGDKPFKCIVDKCHMRFTSRAGLERHVNGHFNTVPAQQKVVKSGESTPTKLLKKRRLKRRRPAGVRTGDFFDSGIMDMLHQQLQDVTDNCTVDISGTPHSLTFHSTVVARRKDESGKIKLLLQWKPFNILPDVWVSESEAEELSKKVVPITQLPPETAANIHPTSYRNHRFRKHRRK
ncbi:zinc finger protein AEBP2 isoform X1 [Patella vulgata]|uniref:zinc finger protein AEBP2 isoform X1 n=2 Tax=Patella vulgata TaxID=6465 RepID=UPI0024A7C619|nr:zinc finger protein AEBP2 isoform X1 [Patella vulgata]